MYAVCMQVCWINKRRSEKIAGSGKLAKHQYTRVIKTNGLKVTASLLRLFAGVSAA
jgi:hypothetical protein